jgi:hypothetical protein
MGYPIENEYYDTDHMVCELNIRLEMITYDETKKRTENNSDIVGGTFDRGRLFFNVAV